MVVGGNGGRNEQNQPGAGYFFFLVGKKRWHDLSAGMLLVQLRKAAEEDGLASSEMLLHDSGLGGRHANSYGNR